MQITESTGSRASFHQARGFPRAGVGPQSSPFSHVPRDCSCPRFCGPHFERLYLKHQYPHRTILYSLMFHPPTSHKHLSCPQKSFLNGILKGCAVWRVIGPAVTELQGFLTWGLQILTGSMHRSVPLAFVCFALKILSWGGCHVIYQLPKERIRQND